MKKKLFTMSALLAAAFSLFAQDSFTVSGTLENLGNEKMILTYNDGSGNVSVEAQAQNGTFTMTGTAPATPVVARMTTSYDRNKYMGENKTSMYMPSMPLEFILSGGDKLQISGEIKNLHYATIQGSRNNAELMEYKKIFLPYLKKYDELQDQLIEARKMQLTDGLQEIAKNMMEAHKSMFQVQKEYAKTHPTQFVSAWLLAMAAKECTLDELKTVYNQFSPEVKNTMYGKAIQSRIEVVAATEGGKPAPDFSKPGIDGKPVTLSQFKGKYVLLDFWGSWCSPCRQSNPHLKEVYAKYKGQGFEILGIACEKALKLTDCIAAWKKAVETDGLTWTQVINNEESMKVDLIQAYGIEGYPTKILIDTDGKIVARWLGGGSAELDAKLKEIFKN